MAKKKQFLQHAPVLTGMKRQKQRFKISSLVLLFFSILIVGGSLYLGILVFQQIQMLETNVQLTENIINANVRTLGQLQRELLRMIVLLEKEENDPQKLERQRAFVTQRMLESELSYQLQTLGTEDLLEDARTLSARWEQEVAPLLALIIADPDDEDDALRLEVIASLTELELEYNQLIAQGEINRKQQAGIANDSTVSTLASARLSIFGLSITIMGFLIFVGLTTAAYSRFDRQREATANELVQLNAEMRKLSQVASHTDNLVIIMDEKGDVEWVNGAFEKLTGYKLAEVVGKQPYQLLQGPDTDRETIREITQSIAKGLNSSRFETFAYAKNKQKFWMALEIQTIHDDQGQFTNYVAIMTDLTLQRQRQLTIAQNTQLLDVINKAQNEFIMTNTPGVMFDRLLDSLLQITASEYGFIGEVLHTEEETPYLKTHAITNIAWSEETRIMYARQSEGGMEFHNLKTLFGAALTTEEPVIANHPGTDPRRGGMPAGHPAMNAFLGMPFFNAGQKMVGLIGIANRPGGYDEELVQFLQPFLATCGNLIEAYRNEQRRRVTEGELVKLNVELEKRSEEITEQRDFALQIMNNMGQGLTVVDENGLFSYVNPAFAKMVNAKPQNLIGHSPEEFTFSADQKSLAEAGSQRRKGVMSTYETRIQRLDGQLLDVLITGVPRYRHGAYAGSIAVITNLTEQKKVEAALRASEGEAQKLSQVASRTDNLVIISDAAGNVEWVNAAFTRVTGYTLDETIGKRPGNLLQGPGSDPDVVLFMREHIQKGEGFNAELLNYAKDGREYWVDIEVQPVYDEQGTLTNFIAIETDITERRQVEQQLRKSKEAAEQAAKAKAAFLASMSHEIRTPLNAVIGLNSLLLNTELSEKQRQFAETARSSGNLLLALINNVLDFSAFESGRGDLEKRPFQLDQVLNELVDLLRLEANRKHLSLAYQIDTAVPPVLIGDETRLLQVLLNLIGNSIKFTEQGEIKLLVRPLVQNETVTLQFSVQDTGIGISQNRLHRLFQPFSQIDPSTTRKYGGSGLGLAISKLIVNKMGGDIRVESEVNKGTTFIFTVQMGIGDATSLPVPTTGFLFDPRMAENKPLRILLVEDDVVNQQVAIHMLDQLGYRADIAASGGETLTALERQGYDIILMDVHMPDMDGVTATMRIHEKWPAEEVPYIIAMTASALDGDRERFIAAGMNDYVSKPVQLKALAAALGNAVAAGPSQYEIDFSAGFEPVNSPVATPPPIDVAIFQQRMGVGQEALLHKLVGLFASEAKVKMIELEKVVLSGSADEVRELAHHLKGSSASASAVSFSAMADALELLASKGDLSNAQDLLAQMAAELHRILAWHQANV